MSDVHLEAIPNAPAEMVERHTAVALVGDPLALQDRPVTPQDFATDSCGMLEFWAENQNSHFWAVDLTDNTLLVFFRETGGSDWTATGESLRDFLLHCTVRESAIGKHVQRHHHC
ncbi:hypothetical protein [Streptomyces sp. WL006]|uniref:hypothetical protein n=1 Tax=Streptomyces sp. WL006 TaxID=3423915 RepID=UPI003F6AC696